MWFRGRPGNRFARPPGSPGRGVGAVARRPPTAGGEPLVSCVVTHFNRGGLLLQALASLRAQTHGNLEVIVVDDGSTDPAALAALAGRAWVAWRAWLARSVRCCGASVVATCAGGTEVLRLCGAGGFSRFSCVGVWS